MLISASNSFHMIDDLTPTTTSSQNITPSRPAAGGGGSAKPGGVVHYPEEADEDVVGGTSTASSSLRLGYEKSTTITTREVLNGVEGKLENVRLAAAGTER